MTKSDMTKAVLEHMDKNKGLGFPKDA